MPWVSVYLSIFLLFFSFFLYFSFFFIYSSSSSNLVKSSLVKLLW